MRDASLKVDRIGEDEIVVDKHLLLEPSKHVYLNKRKRILIVVENLYLNCILR